MTEPARSFQHYEVLRRDDGTAWELGRGAMGVTYKAFDVNLCCEVALKVVSAALVENPEARERFVREARAAAALRHRNVASVYHLGNDSEHFFYAMEFINGDTLDALVRRGGPLSVENTLRVILQVARALAAAERQHLVHRDIKPANLMVTHEDGDEETVVKVIDFGLARPAATAENAPPLTLGGFVGTPQYASPEQLEERPLDARSDIYSLGVTAWFLLTGRAPFAGSLATVCQRQLTQPPPWDLLPVGLPACVRALLGHLLEKDAARRPQNALELRAEIEACLDEVQGSVRRRDLHLPAFSSSAATLSDKATAAARTVRTGTLLNARYRLLQEVGGRDGVRVFQARDESAGDRLVAVKILPEGSSPGTDGQGNLAEEIRLIQAAAHPNLVQVLALDTSKSPAATFVVEEWLAGCTLRELLAGRDGVLPVAETLSLLEQTAAATDHAARCRLDHLELTLTALHLTRAAPGAADDGGQVRALLSRPLAEWPAWTLKVRAFRFTHDPAALDTWSGGATLVPMAGRPGGHAGEPVGGRYIQGLATMVYECLGGSPTVYQAGAESPQIRYASLPVLNEEANLVLRQALSGGGPFDHGWQLHEALTAAIGNEPVRGEIRVPVAGSEVPSRFESAEPPATRGNGSRTDAWAHESTVMAFPFEERPSPVMIPLDGESVAGLFQEGDDPMAGSAWDRLSLVADKRAHPGRWLAGVIGLAAVFGLGFIGVLMWLLQQMPPHDATPKTVVKKRSTEPTASATSKRPTPRLATPAPLAVVASPVPTPPVVSTTPVSTPPIVLATPAVDTPVPAPTPLPVEPLPTPAATLPPERQATVRVDSIPSGAQIRVKDKVLGTAPCRVQLPRGEHELIAHYKDWPETHQTIHLDGTETRATVEIRLMRPDLVPGLLPPSDNRARRATVPAARRVPRAEPPAPPVRAASEPEVRPAQRVLTPFRIDDPTQASPSPSGNRQAFTPDDDEEN